MVIIITKIVNLLQYSQLSKLGNENTISNSFALQG